MRLARSFMSLAGLAAAVATIIVVVLTTGLFDTQCGSVNGRLCNYRGTCGDNGICICLSTFSGDSCEHTASPGYDDRTGNVCFGRGVASPFLQVADIPPECRAKTRNAKLPVVADWSTPRCRARVLDANRRLEAGTNVDLRGIPVCACHPGFGGIMCEQTTCPTSSDLEICSGYGNTSVGLVANNTRTGNGCQCARFVSLNLLAQTMTRAQIEIVQRWYLGSFKRGFCGTPTWIEGANTLVVRQAPGDTVCYCDEEHYGLACQFGVCPEVGGVTCAGHGHSDFGFGLVRAGQPTGPKCRPRCAPGKVPCAEGCDSECRTTRRRCPPDQPFRCANGMCTDPTPHCGRAYAYGVYDDLDAMPRAVACALPAVPRRQLRTACFGTDSTLDSAGFVPGGPMTLDSPVVAVEVELGGAGNWTLTYRGTTHLRTAPGTYHLDLVPTEADHAAQAYVASQLPNVTNLLVGDSTYRISPNPLTMQTLRLHHPLYDVLFEPRRAETAPSPTGFFAMAGITLAGTPIADAACLLDPARCLWRWSDFRSIDGSRWLCRPAALWIASAYACADPIAPRRALATRVASVLVGAVSSLVAHPSGLEWEVQLPAPDPPAPQMTTTPGAAIRRIVVTQLSDIQKPCLCSMSDRNQTQIDTVWYADPNRDRIGKIGDLGLGVRSVGGVVVYARGVVTQLHPAIRMRFRGDDEADFETPPRRLTAREFDMGVVYCNQTTHPARCADASCSRVAQLPIHNVAETCFCTLTATANDCTCVDAFGQTQTYADVEPPPDLDETCAWILAHPPVQNFQGFAPVADGVWVSRESRTQPVLFRLPNCSTAFEMDLPTDRRCENGTLVVRLLGSLDLRAPNWTARTERIPPAGVLFHANRGGIPTDGHRWASSNTADVAATATTSFDDWRSSTTDHSAYVALAFPAPRTLVAIYADFSTVAIRATDGGPPIPVAVTFQGTLAANPRFEDWVTLASVSSDVVDGTDIHSVAVHGSWLAVRAYSYFPLGVRTFVPFVEQNCTGGTLEGTPPDLAARLAALRAAPPSTVPGCRCNDLCLLGGDLPAGRNGVCEDEIHFNRTADGTDICAAGTDCADCRTSVRLLDNSTSCRGDSPLLDQMLDQNLTGTLQQYVFLGNATLRYTRTFADKTVWRWTKPDCVRECRFHTCSDGTCTDSPADCTPTLYDCPGNGCVRADIDRREYKCACEQGWSGLRCSLNQCTPGDPATGKIDPHAWCTCNGPSPLKIKPPFDLVWTTSKTYFDDDEILAINRPSPRTGPDDVGWVNIQADKAPYGIAFLRRVARTNATFFTTCPYAVRTAGGVFLELEQCVESRTLEAPFPVQAWRVQPNGETIRWDYETQYDDAPYRCPTGHCVAQERECYQRDYVDPQCGGIGGICLADGTCRCPVGTETFIVNNHLSGQLQVPYSNVAGRTNPVVWGKPNDNRWVSEWCQARNCTQVDCTPPSGCYPGTPRLDFVDRQYECPEPHFPGQCGEDIHSCLAGEVVPPKVCSGNGVLRKRDYRPNEWYCECGDYLNNILVPNGYGGARCQDYRCQDDPKKLWFVRNQRHTTEPFRDLDGNPLPGRWSGPCGATVGANPDDIVEWNTCCEGVTQLETCTNIPCVVGGVMQCLDVDQCVGTNRIPKVYACNGKGTALADGSCACTTSQETGIGYAADLSVYSTGGCYARVQCAKSVSTGKVCNAKQSCGDFDSWTNLPDIPYITQQAAMFAAREGLPISNRSIVSRMVGDELEQVVLDTYVRIAMDIQAAIRAIATDICVYPPPDNSSVPFGMLPYVGKETVVGPYAKSLRQPYLITGTTSPATPWLVDGVWRGDWQSWEVPVTAQFSSTVGAGTALSVVLPRAFQVSVIRVRGRFWNPTLITFTGSGATSICPPAAVSPQSPPFWVGTFCIQTFVGFRFDIEMPNEWHANGCEIDPTSVPCERWMQTTCPTLPNGNLRLPGSLDLYTGCGSARCCIATTQPFPTTTLVTVRANTSMALDEIMVYGYADSTLPFPQGLRTINLARTNQSDCADEIFMNSPDVRLGGQLSLFKTSTAPELQAPATTQPGALAACENQGGVLASLVLDTDAGSYADAVGQTCGSGTCWVGARDRNEIRAAVDLAHIIHPNCRTYGCYNKGVSVYSDDIRTVHSRPGNGSIWGAGGNLNVGWKAFMDRMALVVGGNSPGPLSHKRHVFSGDVYSMVADYSMPPSNQPTYPTYFEKTGTWTQDWVTTGGLTGYDVLKTGLQPWIENALDPGFQMPPRPGNYFDIWSATDTCRITLYSLPNCGIWRGSRRTSDSFWRPGFRKVIHVMPSNYHQTLYQVFPGDLWTYDECAVEAPDEAQANCNRFDYDSPLTPSIRSYRVEGPCWLYMWGRAENEAGSDRDFRQVAYDTTETKIGSTAYFYGSFERGMIFDLNAKLFGGWPRRRWRSGCWPQIWGQGSQNPPSDYAGDETFFQRNIFQTYQNEEGIVRARIFSFRIMPMFSAVRTRVWPMGTPYNENVGTDREEAGYMDNPLLCMAVRAEIISRFWRCESIFDCLDTNIDQTSIPLTDGRLLMPDLTKLTGAFMHGPTCRATKSQGVHCPIVVPFKDCDKPYPACSQCDTPRVAEFEWDQRFFTGNSFLAKVGTIYASAETLSPAPFYPQIDMWVDLDANVRYTGSIKSIYPTPNGYADSFKLSFAQAQAHAYANLKPSDYDTKFWMKHCLTVQRSSTGVYKFVPEVCLRNTFPAVCVRDTYKYTIACGRQCDKCGDCARTRSFELGATAFTRYPRASAQYDPFGHSVLADYLSGSLQVNVANMDQVPWDLVYQQMQGSSFIFAFPEAVRMFTQGISTRPGLVSVGQTADPAAWIDMDFARWFPYACGVVPNPFTGERTERCAVSRDHCADFVSVGGIMARSSIPTMLTGNFTGDLTLEPRCGTTVDATAYGQQTRDGPAQPDNGDFQVGPTQFKVLHVNATWRNTGRPSNAPFHENCTLTGSIRTSVRTGQFRIWVGSLSPTFTTPTVLLYLNDWTPLAASTTNYRLALRPGNRTTLQVLGFDFRALQIGSTLTLSPTLVTSATTIAQCRNRSPVLYRELPLAVQSFAPHHECVFVQTGDIEVGDCACEAGSAYGGPGCDWPTVTTPQRGKQVCNRFGDNGGYALTRSLDRAKVVSTTGVYLDGRYACKCVDQGVQFWSVLRPASAFDYAYVFTSDKDPNRPDFMLVADQDIPTTISIPVQAGSVQDVCRAFSALLPSWNTADETDAIAGMAVTPLFVDVELREGRLMWDRRNERVAGMLATNTTIAGDPCTNTTLCASLNWNNLAFLRATPAGLTDGKRATVTVTTPMNITLAAPRSNLVVEMWLARLELGFAARTNVGICTSTDADALLNRWVCSFADVRWVALSRVDASPAQITDVRMFPLLDSARVPGYFTK